MKEMNIPVGVSDFEEIRKNGYYYIDKSGLIGELLSRTGTKVTLITRPRRFGKTLGMSMLENFFDIRKNSRKLFEGLEIAEHQALCDAWMNQYPTISISFRQIDGLNFMDAYQQLVYEIALLYQNHTYLLDSQVISKQEKFLFQQISDRKAEKTDVLRSIQFLTLLLNKHYNKKVILLIDEYDVPVAKANNNGYYTEMLDVMKGLMQALKDNQALQFAVVTGCLKIAKESIFFTVVDDFNAQQLPFATAVWNMLHSGDVGEWSWNIDLGSSFITTFSFYDLGSPFIWLSLLAPRGVFPYLAGFLYIIKYVTAATTAYLYLRLFVDKHQWAVIGALVYAFSGYQTTNLEFFHFHDVVAIFPLLLWGLEMSMKDRKYRPAFVLTIFINCLLNYFFFVGEVVFLVIYYLIRYRKLPVRQFVSGIFTCALYSG